jgi:hypothetical protein
MCESNRSAVIVGAEQEDNRSSAIFADVQVCKLSLVLEQSPVAIVIANLAGEIEYVNSALQRNSGYHQDELIGPQPRMRLCRGGLRLNASTDQASGHARSLLSLPESARLGAAWGAVGVAAMLLARPSLEVPTIDVFAGTVDFNNGGATGQSLSGSLTLDVSTFYSFTTDGLTHNSHLGLFNNPAWCPSCTPQQSNPLQVSGQAHDVGTQLSIGGGSAWDRGAVGVSRNSSGGMNQFFAEGVSTDSNGIQRVIRIQTEDFLGTASRMFTDPNGGLDLAQGINWFAPGAASRFEIREFPTLICCAITYQAGSLTSVSTVSSVPEPERYATLLVGMGVLWLTAGRRMRNRSALPSPCGSVTAWWARVGEPLKPVDWIPAEPVDA